MDITNKMLIVPAKVLYAPCDIVGTNNNKLYGKGEPICPIIFNVEFSEWTLNPYYSFGVETVPN